MLTALSICTHQIQGAHRASKAASTATKDGAAIQPMSFTTLNDVVSELDAKASQVNACNPSCAGPYIVR